MDWHTYFMNLARVAALKSKDPRTKVGCLLVNQDKHIISTGYNGFPPGFPEWPELWLSSKKYDYVVHAEANCLLHATSSIKNSIMYTTLYPCKDCAKLLLTAGIKTVYYLNKPKVCEVADRLLNHSKADIKLIEFKDKT